MFREDKATQLAGFFLALAGDTLVDRFDCLKLMFAAERLSLDDRGCLIVGDDFYNMKWGPVMSKTYDCMKGKGKGVWVNVISQKNSHHLALTGPGMVPDVLSVEELSYANQAWEKYRQILQMPLAAKIDFMHSEFPEWKAPKEENGQTRLHVKDILQRGLGRGQQESTEVQETLDNISALKRFASRYA